NPGRGRQEWRLSAVCRPARIRASPGYLSGNRPESTTIGTGSCRSAWHRYLCRIRPVLFARRSRSHRAEGPGRALPCPGAGRAEAGRRASGWTGYAGRVQHGDWNQAGVPGTHPGDGGPGTVPPDFEPESSDGVRSEEHTSELQSRENLVCRLLLEKKKNKQQKKRTCTNSRKTTATAR